METKCQRGKYVTSALNYALPSSTSRLITLGSGDNVKRPERQEILNNIEQSQSSKM